MHGMLIFVLALFGLAPIVAIDLITFDGAKGTTFEFKTLNDPVMGGLSQARWSVDQDGKFGTLDGEVVNVPQLKAPGFITAQADGRFRDISSAANGDLVLTVRTTTPTYDGFFVSFFSGPGYATYSCAAGGSMPLSRGCFKAKFSVPAGTFFTTVRIPFNSFSDKWSPYTGEPTTTCAQDEDVCPTAAKLKHIGRIAVWGEGAAGKVHLEIQSITAEAALSLVTFDGAKGTEAALSLVTFDGAKGTTFEFSELNDPVMGGRSTGTWTVNDVAHVGVIDGEVVDVPSLKAPGFIKAAADGKFVDISDAIGGSLVLVLRTSTPEYKGFRVSFFSGWGVSSYSCAGGGGIPFSRGCFKAKFSVPAGDNFTMVRIPFSQFSDMWSSATGEQTTTCSEDHDVCPSAAKLKSISRLELWGEGFAGKLHLEVKSIFAETASGALQYLAYNQRPRPEDDACSGPVQSHLLYGISGRTEATVPIPVSQGESLAEAVCCDKRALPFAEPQFLYQAPDIDLFSKLGKGVTVFYDSVCGKPLFRAPINRTLADFRADTDEHGWPSFRSAEVVVENVRTDIKTGFVTSSCGTHLGSYLPDSKGARWCIDLSCIAGVKLAVELVV